MNKQYEYILEHTPKEGTYDENLHGLIMVPIEGFEPIPVRFILSKENPYNFTFFVFHSAEKDIKEIEEEMKMVTKIFKARCISFDYPGYGLNKNKKDIDLVLMVDAVLKRINKRGYREDRILLFGYEHGCGPALQYATVLAERKKEKLSLESSGIILFYPLDTIPLGVDYHFPKFFNSVQNVVYFRVLMMIPKRDSYFTSLNQLRKIGYEDHEWKDRVEVCVHSFSRLKPTSLNKVKILKLLESTNPWFKKLNNQINKYKHGKINISMVITTVMKVNKKIPSIPIHNDFFIMQFLERNKLEDFIPIFEERKIYSVVYTLMGNIETNILVEENKTMLDKFSNVVRQYRQFVSKDWDLLRKDVLCETLNRIEINTNILMKQKSTLHQLKENPINIPHEIEMDKLSTKTSKSERFTIPKWAKGIECNFEIFTYQSVNFSDYFSYRDSLKTKHLSSLSK
ncbi:hypothetical protein EDI_133060 [Entamoeba dispar SAW760]|uniref:Serine aminopeptidase S33 domain-containing protein n=1 Tax=Entamoeba dispar (strain ATCC PRA-260 / SAW760) TaxID=370354 RepID=B0EJE4_ENTDS|nr:uncharacterized protein EDI_133060 [Entamoeba dispar SAW760]EDR25339.1 hypothetical protein EDI_133060 [Entamoeba dispar SAW760]|eukprot:EDR25339.1 hypothetical protein EDI_133060 [Entamoeba dispar SAW760]